MGVRTVFRWLEINTRQGIGDDCPAKGFLIFFNSLDEFMECRLFRSGMECISEKFGLVRCIGVTHLIPSAPLAHP
jgi:hypothetical protein